MAARKDTLELRSRVLEAVRAFFTDRGFVEVETPVRLPLPAMELNIDAEPSGDFWLRTSPELHMKRLLAAGMGKIFQVGPCFRRGERGKLHRPEYTMLEWYRADADYTDILVDTKALISGVAEKVLGSMHLSFGGQNIELLPVWEVLTVRDAFIISAGWDPFSAFDADRFDMDLVSRVEPYMPADRPAILKDYPPEQAALARLRDEGGYRVAERWELYIGGMELANAFSELNDPEEQRRRFEECAAARHEADKTVYGIDEDFMAALERGMPPSGGCALGIDRLVMLLAGADSIDDVVAF
jgi:lysyl-tRNA synthetase class 2